jgi:hypothetical protein
LIIDIERPVSAEKPAPFDFRQRKLIPRAFFGAMVQYERLSQAGLIVPKHAQPRILARHHRQESA